MSKQRIVLTPRGEALFTGLAAVAALVILPLALLVMGKMAGM